ncbi:putative mannosyl-oligosaccharide alpha-1,2-mannosidase [Fusarium oxysporum f. sp. matthiolae]|nr:putative mannosyl-oligosaccharide alpha-1,2-mannosidase [Fusarium oxysporum f. sp. matthiolae]
MQRSVQKAIIWLGAIFITYHVFSLLFSRRASQPSHSDPNLQKAPAKLKGDPLRAKAIVQAFRFSWNKYEEFAAPHDTLLPISKTFEDDRNGWGATAVDGLSTAIIMEDAEIVDKILRQIMLTDFTVTVVPDQPISLFETTIRYLGAYDLLFGSYKHLCTDMYLRNNLLKAAVILADRLSVAFDTPSGIPDDEIIFNPQLRRFGNIDNSITCFGTLVLEWTRLSDLTGNQTYAKLAQRAQDHLIHPKTKQSFTLPGLIGTYVKLKDGYFGDYQAGWGGGSDSYYEYLIKMYAYDSVAFAEYGESWIQAAESSMLYLASSPSTRPDLTFLGEMRGNTMIPISSHLASVCGGSLILGGLLLQNQTFVDFGVKLSESYYEVYRQSPSGIGPELFRWVDDGRQPLAKASSKRLPAPKWQSFYEKSGYYHTNAEYILRPETIESLYYAYRATGDRKYQDWAWEAFEALNRMCKVEGGYTGLKSVMKTKDDKTRKFVDKMESFWLAETLKYLYLMFAEDSELQVRSDGKMKYVLNTEAHPLLVRGE